MLAHSISLFSLHFQFYYTNMLQCPIKFWEKKKHTWLLHWRRILCKTLNEAVEKQEPFYFGIKVITRPMYWYIKRSHPWEEIIKKCILPKLYISIHKEWHTQGKVIKWNCCLGKGKIVPQYWTTRIMYWNAVRAYELTIHNLHVTNS